MQPCSMYWELVVGTVLSELLGVSNYMIINMLSTCVHLKASLFQLQIAKLTSMFEYESKKLIIMYIMYVVALFPYSWSEQFELCLMHKICMLLSWESAVHILGRSLWYWNSCKGQTVALAKVWKQLVAQIRAFGNWDAANGGKDGDWGSWVIAWHLCLNMVCICTSVV